MNRRFFPLCLALLAVTAAVAQETPLPVDPPADAPSVVVGGAVMDRGAPAMDNLARSGDHARLSQALEAAGLAGTLRGGGPFTVFAPTDSAFSSSTYESFDELLKAENRGLLADLLRYHIVAGLFDIATLDARLDADSNRTMLTTVTGHALVVERSASGYTVTDATNHTARLTVTDAYQSNGVVHVVDRVLMPETR
jgi:uncharacterized surface protein with fasciclin (FAS1) repeats